MRKIIGISLVIFTICLSFAACSKPNDKNGDVNNFDTSGITEGVGDAVLDVDDIFGDGSGSSNEPDASVSQGSSGSQSSDSNSSGNGTSDSNSENGTSGGSSDSASSEGSSDNGNSNSSGGSSKIDYEDPNVWTEPVGGQ